LSSGCRRKKKKKQGRKLRWQNGEFRQKKVGKGRRGPDMKAGYERGEKGANRKVKRRTKKKDSPRESKMIPPRSASGGD